jgi:hypothetical protein
VSSRLPSTRHRSMNVIAMNFQPGALFKKSVTDCQRIGARGGRAGIKTSPLECCGCVSSAGPPLAPAVAEAR